ncbi:hypothetical protein ABPG74_012985 [Tetrahymena malaccensis]
MQNQTQQQQNQNKPKQEQLKKFTFFDEKDVDDKNKPVLQPLIQEDEISKIEYINQKLFLASKKTKSVIIYEDGNQPDTFIPFQGQLFSIYSAKNYLIAHGLDSEQNAQSQLKFYDTNVKDKVLMKTPKYTMPASKDALMKDCNAFCITEDMQGIALGFNDGSVIIYQSKQDKQNFSYKDLTLKPHNSPIRQLFFTRLDGNLNLFITTDDAIQCWQKCNKKVALSVSGGNLFDVTSRGTLIGCTKANPSVVIEFDINKHLNQNDIRLEDEKYEKQLIKSHSTNYLIILSKLGEDFQIIILDTLNQYIAHKVAYKSVQVISSSKEYIHLIQGINRQKKLIRLKEKENAYKIEYFFKRSQFDVAYKFAKNQDSDPALLAEISRLHGDNLYTKSDYNEAIKKYIQTIGFIEPSYIIRKFLDVAHIEYLIQYLQEVHDKQKADKHHTALLLNCFVKQKKIDELDKFLTNKKDSKQYDVELFDIETAIKVCREAKKNDLALRLAEQKDQYEQYIEILLEMEQEGQSQQTEKAINYIRNKVELNKKEMFIIEFGQVLMKNCSEKCLELIQKIVMLRSLRKCYDKQQQQNSQSSSKLSISAEQKAALDYFGLKESHIPQIYNDLLNEPDKYFHIFVNGKDEFLERYLKFLTDYIDLFDNQKALLHRLFEFYLEKYHLESKKQNLELSKNTKGLTVKQEKEQYIKDLLKDTKFASKYDKNHLLVLFKMYNFEPGIIHLYNEMRLKEELLNFYIMTNQGDKIIETCKDNKEETNLWVQALKYFTHPDRFTKDQKEQTEQKLQKILQNIQNLNTLSPLLVLNILAKNKNVEFKIVKEFFIQKLQEDRNQIEKDKQVVEEKTKEANQDREEYMKLKTQAKIFSQKQCQECTNDLSGTRVHFMCGHSYHDQCLHGDSAQKECEKCADNFKPILNRKEGFDEKASDSTQFLENISRKENKFDTIASYLGKGLFSQSILNGKNNQASNNF